MRAVGCAALVALMWGCVRPPEPRPQTPLPGATATQVSGDRAPAMGAGFEPPPPLADPPPADPRVPGADYLEAVARPIQLRWSSFLEDLRLRLPPTDPLNDPHLAVVLAFAVAPESGVVSEVEVVEPSGQAGFDAAAVEVVRDASPLPPPDASQCGDDRVARLRWTFARDRRQAGPATAQLTPTRWPPPRAVPALLARGEVAAAARRLVGDGVADDARLELLDQVALAAIAAAVRSRDPRRAARGATLVGELGLGELAAPVAALARAGDAAARADALRALAALEPQAAVELAGSVLGEPGADGPLLEAAADVLVAGGEADRVVEIAGEALAKSDERRLFGLLLAAHQAVPARADVIAATLEGGGSVAPLAAAAAAQLARAGDRSARAALVRCLGSGDAGLRLACVRAVGAGASRRLAAALADRLADRDERVRAAAIAALAAARPRRLAASLRRFEAERSPLVLAALARALGGARGARATRVLLRLLDHRQPEVRAAAAASLGVRRRGGRRVAALTGDADPAVRRAALWAADAGELRRQLETPGLGAAALAALLSRGPAPRAAAEALGAGDEDDRLAAARAWLRWRRRATLKP